MTSRGHLLAVTVACVGIASVGVGCSDAVRARPDATTAATSTSGSGGAGGDATTSSATSQSTAGGCGSECAPHGRCADETTLIAVDRSGNEQSIDCGVLGCCEDHCCAVVPSNSADLGFLQSTGLTNVATGTFDTDADCLAPSLLGNCEPVSVEGAPAVCVCRADTITIQNLVVSGSRALAIIAKGTVTVTDLLSVGAQLGAAGPGASFDTYPGDPPQNGERIAGGSFGTKGGGAFAAEPYGNETLVPLRGGMRGASACDPLQAGGGGGALQITAGVLIDVRGVIQAGGGGGVTTSCGDPGSGGGSGGAVLLEAPGVTITGVVAANGGAGSGGDGSKAEGTPGSDGLPNATAAPGGSGGDGDACVVGQPVQGGDGGVGSFADGPGGAGQPAASIDCIGSTVFVAAGGHGGGAGRIRINTTTGCQCGGVLSPSASIGSLVFE